MPGRLDSRDLRGPGANHVFVIGRVVTHAAGDILFQLQKVKGFFCFFACVFRRHLACRRPMIVAGRDEGTCTTSVKHSVRVSGLRTVRMNN